MGKIRESEGLLIPRKELFSVYSPQILIFKSVSTQNFVNEDQKDLTVTNM